MPDHSLLAKVLRIATSPLALWLVLIAMFLGIWQFLSPDTPPTEQMPARRMSPGVAIALASAPVLFFIGIAVGLVWRARTSQRSMIRGSVLMGRDPKAAQALFERLARSPTHLIASEAHLALAWLAEREASFDVALAHADTALERAKKKRAGAYDLLLPQIHATRAFALAALDRKEEARRELALLEKGFPAFFYLERTRVRVELLLLIKNGDIRNAAKLSGARPPDLPISYREEILGEIAEMVERTSAVSREKLDRLRYEIDSDPVLSDWLDVVTPDLMGRFSEIRPA
jgi:hypothetical protein